MGWLCLKAILKSHIFLTFAVNSIFNKHFYS